jgi:hypothetical protein
MVVIAAIMVVGVLYIGFGAAPMERPPAERVPPHSTHAYRTGPIP